MGHCCSDGKSLSDICVLTADVSCRKYYSSGYRSRALEKTLMMSSS